jgi:hypothetical protein
MKILKSFNDFLNENEEPNFNRRGNFGWETGEESKNVTKKIQPLPTDWLNTPIKFYVRLTSEGEPAIALKSVKNKSGNVGAGKGFHKLGLKNQVKLELQDDVDQMIFQSILYGPSILEIYSKGKYEKNNPHSVENVDEEGNERSLQDIINLFSSSQYGSTVQKYMPAEIFSNKNMFGDSIKQNTQPVELEDIKVKLIVDSAVNKLNIVELDLNESDLIYCVYDKSFYVFNGTTLVKTEISINTNWRYSIDAYSISGSSTVLTEENGEMQMVGVQMPDIDELISEGIIINDMYSTPIRKEKVFHSKLVGVFYYYPWSTINIVDESGRHIGKTITDKCIFIKK